MANLDLCNPASTYLIISLIALLIMFFQNIGNTNIYCVGMQQCDVYNTSFIFVVKLVFVIFWTWILNLLCSYGETEIAWFMVIVPFLLMFIIIALFMLNNLSNNSWYYYNALSYVNPLAYYR